MVRVSVVLEQGRDRAVEGRETYGPVKAIQRAVSSKRAVKAVDFLSDPKRKKKKVKTTILHSKNLIEKTHFFFLV
jgi:hypothetical protein